MEVDYLIHDVRFLHNFFKVTKDRLKQNKNDHGCILLFLKEHASYWKKKTTGLSPDTTNKQSQLLHL